MNLTAGTVLDSGKYVCDTQLSQGVFGITYRASDTKSGETVIIKTLGDSLRQHSEFDRFKQQILEVGDRLRRCQHPNLVRVLGCFEEAGRPYLVMEYISGQTLSELVQSNGLPPAKAIKYIRQIGNALRVLHKAGLLHRDIKPQNIIRHQGSDRVVLCEFGITCELTPGVMQTYASLLSAGYAPVEFYSYDAQRTPATDIYALTATFYCLLTGRPPLPAPVRQTLQTDGKGMTAQAHYLSFPDWQQGLPKINPAFKQAIVRGLQLAAEKRPQTVEAWLSLLPKPQKPPTSQPAVAQPSPTLPRVSQKASPRQDSPQANVKPAPKKRPIPQLPAPDKIPAPQPALVQQVVAKPKADTFALPLQSSVQVHTKPAAKRSETPQPSLLEKNLASQLASVQHLLTKLKTEAKAKGTVPVKFKISALGLPLPALLITGAIAASAGVGFGFALRINRPDVPGSTILHTKQSFPPRSDWPVSEPRL